MYQHWVNQYLFIQSKFILCFFQDFTSNSKIITADWVTFCYHFAPYNFTNMFLVVSSRLRPFFLLFFFLFVLFITLEHYFALWHILDIATIITSLRFYRRKNINHPCLVQTLYYKVTSSDWIFLTTSILLVIMPNIWASIRFIFVFLSMIVIESKW